jgi:hypothetical protein
MSAGLALVGGILLLFGWASQPLLGDLTPVARLQAVVGALCLLAAALLSAVRAGRAAEPGLRGPLLRVLARGAGTVALAALLYAASTAVDLRLDWTGEGHFTLSEATTGALAQLPEPLGLTLYRLTGDPRIRHTRLLLEEFARHGQVEVRTLDITQVPEDEDRYGIGSSNSVVATLGPDWRLIQRPREGTLYEAIAGLLPASGQIIYTAVGAGEGDLERGGAGGYSGLGAALENAGYTLRRLPLAVVDAVPDDAAGLLIVAPRRTLPGRALEAVERYLDGGGSLVAFLEPGRSSGLASLLAHYGLNSPDRWVVDPSALPVEGEPAGLAPVASAYSSHPATHGLGANRMTFFPRARAFELRKARPEDRLKAIVHTSHDAWTDPEAGKHTAGSLPEPPADARHDYHALVAVAELERGGGRARIVAFGDADFASNRYLRTLYNLDLVLNSVHWALERESAIALQPKSGGRQLIQFPIPLETSLQSLYGAGLLVPELLVLAGALTWLRQRRG